MSGVRREGYEGRRGTYYRDLVFSVRVSVRRNLVRVCSVIDEIRMLLFVSLSLLHRTLIVSSKRMRDNGRRRRERERSQRESFSYDFSSDSISQELL